MPAIKLSQSYYVDENGRGHSRITDYDKRDWPILEIDDSVDLCKLALSRHGDTLDNWAGNVLAKAISPF